jgi:hypothetical protein
MRTRASSWATCRDGPVHSQGATLDELRTNLLEVIDMLREDGEPTLEATFVGTQTLEVAGPPFPITAVATSRPA